MHSRRTFLRTAASAVPAALTARTAGAQTATEPSTPANLLLGFDNFSIRAFGWNADQLLDYAASRQIRALLLSDLDVYPSLGEAALRDTGKRARDLGVALFAGTGGICPTSRMFRNNRGTAPEHLRLAIRTAKALGSPIVRCYLGGADDRKSEGGIAARIEDTLKVLREVRSEAVDAGVRIAIENHAGDMQARELRTLVEAAGTDFVGVTIDSGNATWTLEDPLENLEILGPYTVCSGIRDSMVWQDADGAVVQWTAMGEGCVDMKAYARRFAELCPSAPFILEIISGFARPYPWRKPEFWKPYETSSPAAFAGFLKLAEKGRRIPPWSPPSGSDPDAATRDYQKAELERSIDWCRRELGMA